MTSRRCAMRRRIKALISDELASPSQSRSTLMNTSQRRTRVWPCLVIASANGDIYVAGSSAVPGGGRATVTRFNASGAVISTYTDPSEPSNTSTLCLGAKPLLDSRNRFVAPCLRLGEFGYRQLAALRLLTEANQLVADVTFGSNGFSLVGTTSGYFIRSSNAVAQDANSG